MHILSVLTFQRRTLTGLLLFAVMLMTGCAILEEKDETAGWAAEEILSAGQKQMASGDWVGAIETYKKLLGRFPYGRIAEQAQ
ncbi:MAG: tetratricopeptide repeat protein, partial [Proteobacteria bacterium]|nr:tetratricopeptide repeat protein [Pseudomonadota bacterium]